MKFSVSAGTIEPVPCANRSTELDAMRGAALLGVLMVNLLTGFRVSLFEHILTPHTHPGWVNISVDILAAWLLQFKAMVLFSFLFGVGLGIQVERAALHEVDASRFLVRRFATLLAIGLCHMFLVWNGDILTLYAVCGQVLIPFIRMTAKQLSVLGIALILLSPYLSLVDFPTKEAMRAHAVVATHVYARGNFNEIMALRFSEAVHFILPPLLSSMIRTSGLMLLGVATWRSGFLRQPKKWRASRSRG